MHGAAHCLDPEFQSIAKTHKEGEDLKLKGLYECINRVLRGDTEKIRKAREQWTDYQLKRGVFSAGYRGMWEAAKTMPAADWW